MTDVGRMSVGELVGKVLADEHADVLRQAVCWLAQELMEAEVAERAGAGYGERSGERVARRNGDRERAWTPGSARLSWPSQAAVGQLLPQLPGAASAQRAGAGGGGAGGLCQRGVDP